MYTKLLKPWQQASCWSEPRDLRPALKKLTKAIDRRLAALPPAGLLVIVMGEIHSMPAHVLLQRMLVSHLIDRENKNPADRFAVGYELPHNYPLRVIDHFRKGRVPLTSYALDGVPRDDLYLQALFATQTRYAAKLSNEYLFNHLYHNRVPFSFNDAADGSGKGQRGLLDFSDEATGALLREVMPGADKTSEIGVMSPEGMAFRNLFIVRRSLDHARRAGARIYVQHCGMGHVVGKADVFNTEASLMRLYEGAGADVLPVIIDPRNEDYGMPLQTMASMSDAFAVFGMESRRTQTPFEEKCLLEDLLYYSGQPSDMKVINAALEHTRQTAKATYRALAHV